MFNKINFNKINNINFGKKSENKKISFANKQDEFVKTQDTKENNIRTAIDVISTYNFKDFANDMINNGRFIFGINIAKICSCDEGFIVKIALTDEISDDFNQFDFSSDDFRRIVSEVKSQSIIKYPKHTKEYESLYKEFLAHLDGLEKNKK